MLIRLFGTGTSPYVRRVLVVAHELGLANELELVDTATDAGQTLLRERSPIWKIPAAEIAGTLVFDSHVITELLLVRHGADKLAPLALDDIAARNAISVIDGALDGLINCLYLARDGLTSEQSPYLAKQHERAAAALAWLEAQVFAGAPWLTSQHPDPRERRLGLPEIALATTLGWMRFRAMGPFGSRDRYPTLLAWFEQIDTRDSFARTRPRA